MKHTLLNTLFVISLLLIVLPATEVLLAETSSPLEAPDFTLNDINGRSHTLSDYRGRPVILNFWASWCADCLDEMPSLQSLYTILGGAGLVVLGVTIDRDIRTVNKVLEKVRVTYPVLMETTGDVFINSYTITKLPVTIFIDKNGYIVRTISGGENFMSNKMQDFVRSLL